MKFKFKIQQYQSDAVNAIADVFRGQPYVERTKYTRDLGVRTQTAQIDAFESGDGAAVFEEEKPKADPPVPNPGPAPGPTPALLSRT